MPSQNKSLLEANRNAIGLTSVGTTTPEECTDSRRQKNIWILRNLPLSKQRPKNTKKVSLLRWPQPIIAELLYLPKTVSIGLKSNFLRITITSSLIKKTRSRKKRSRRNTTRWLRRSICRKKLGNYKRKWRRWDSMQLEPLGRFGKMGESS